MEAAGYGSNTAHRVPAQDCRSPGMGTVVDRDSVPYAGEPGDQQAPAVHQMVAARGHLREAGVVHTYVHREPVDPDNTFCLGSTGQTSDRNASVDRDACSTSPVGTGCRQGPGSS